jgi:hypothetical protein
MRCPSCGHEVPDQPFCDRCGKSLKIEKSDPIEPKSDPALGPKRSSPALSVAAPDAKPAYKPDNASSHPRWYGVVWATLAIALYVAIADAAVETFLRHSPLRWWIAGAAALYLGLCTAAWRLLPGIWRRMDWAIQAAVSLAVLLVLLGATAWMPEGLEQGLSLFGQTTATVLAVVSAVVVALSGVLLARISFIPLPGKIAVGLLAAYGVAAFLLAVHAGTPYASLFHGGSLWTRLPFWLQGAFVGGLLLVPLALLLQIGTGIRRITRDKSAEFAFKVIALGLGLAITFAAVRLPAGDVSGASATASANPADTPTVTSSDTPTNPATGTSTDSRRGLSGNQENPAPDEVGYKQASAQLDLLYAGMDMLNSKIDRSLFEIDALADRLGSDPVAIFHFVRDQIRYEPYTGVLRGALGTLLCRAGNSLDRSLLLAALLQKAGLKTQIASAQLTAQQAQPLVNRMFEPVKPVPPSVPAIAELAPALAAAVGADQGKFTRAVDVLRRAGEEQKKKLLNYADNQTSSLLSLFGKAAIDPVITPKDKLLAEASDHYWVQYQDPSGQWVDLDSSFADAELGKPIVPATTAFAADSVPEGLFHNLQVTLTLRVAQIVDGSDGPVTDEILIDKQLRIADQQGKDIVALSAPVPLSSSPGLSLAQALAATKGFQTALQVGNDVIPGKYFDLDGQVSDQPGGPVGAVVQNAGGIGRSVGGIAGGIGGALGGATSTEAATRIVGAWADYTLISPQPHGDKPMSHRYHRDIVAAAQVTAWSVNSPDGSRQVPTKLDKAQLRQRLFWRAQLLPVVGAIAGDYPGYLAVKLISENHSWIDALAKTAFGSSQIGSLPNLSNPPPLQNLYLAEGAIRLANDVGQSKFPAVRSYFGTPGLVAYEKRVDNTTDRAYIRRGYDIVAFPSRTAVNDASPSSQMRRDAATLSLLGGVIAAELESGLTVPPKGSSGESTHGPASFSTSAASVLRAASETGVPVVLLKPGAVGLKTLTETSMPDSVKAELSATLAAGNDLVVPTKPIVLDGREQLAWWRFDPTSGEVIGVMPGGRGQAMEEYVWPIISVLTCGYDEVRNEMKEDEPKGPGRGMFLLCLMAAGGFWAGAYGAGTIPQVWYASNIAAYYPELWALADMVSVFAFHCSDAPCWPNSGKSI